MAVINANGFGGGSTTLYANSMDLYVWGSFSSVSAGLYHRNPFGVGPSYGAYPGWALSVANGTVPLGVAKGMSFWMTSSNPGVASLNVQFGRDGAAQVNVRFRGSGNIELYRGTTLLTTLVAVYDGSAPHWVQLEVVCANSGGSIDITIDGVHIGATPTYTGDTQDGANPDWSQWGWDAGLANSPNGINSGGEWVVCDVLITDSGGTIPECYSNVIVPNADETPLQLTPSTGTTHYVLVDEIPFSDADYNSTAVSGDADVYGNTPLAPTAPTIICTTTWSRCTNLSTLTHGQTLVVSAGTTSTQTAQSISSVSYTVLSYLLTTDPATNTAWTQAGVNAMSTGIKFTT